MHDSELDSPVRHVLDRMENTHRRIMIFGWLTVAGTLASYAWLSHVANTSNSVQRVIMASVLALTSVIAWSTFAVAILIFKMGKRILRALEAIAGTK
jgi:hypothetical protein